MTASKALSTMIRGKDPVDWMVAADMVGEQGGDGDLIGSAIRRRAALIVAIAASLKQANRGVGKVTRGERAVGDGVGLWAEGGEKVMNVFLCSRERRVSFILHVRRDLLSRPDYLNRRAAELADAPRLKDFVAA